MNNPLHEFEERLKASSHGIDPGAKHVLEKLQNRLHIARNTNREFFEHMSLGDRVADRVAAFGGSWTFIFSALAVLVFWVLLNTIFLIRAGKHPFDPYPFILLNLFLSMTAALQAPVIMMSQNRQSAKDRLQAEHDYEVNLKAEMEILTLHAKVDAMRLELMEMQEKQCAMLEALISAGKTNLS